jgi:hypothetical protein
LKGLPRSMDASPTIIKMSALQACETWGVFERIAIHRYWDMKNILTWGAEGMRLRPERATAAAACGRCESWRLQRRESPRAGGVCRNYA